ncbi:MAG: DUF2892 domain-containing protein [Ignavibacteria bacterium]|nr:DUF2892 domain-containing protein [Ignavibacteria bacterium]
MNKNIGSTDKIIRITVGVVLLIIAILDPSSNWWGFIGIVPLFTAFVGVCPAYSLLKLSTLKSDKK